MGFFAEFNTWLNGLLAGYIGDNTARIASALEPAIVTLGVVYVMVWGYLELTGQIQEPFIGGVKRIITLAVILGCALDLWLYNSLIVDTFFSPCRALRSRCSWHSGPSLSRSSSLIRASASSRHGSRSWRTTRSSQSSPS
jgi:hypothetical protein